MHSTSLRRRLRSAWTHLVPEVVPLRLLLLGQLLVGNVFASWSPRSGHDGRRQRRRSSRRSRCRRRRGPPRRPRARSAPARPLHRAEVPDVLGQMASAPRGRSSSSSACGRRADARAPFGIAKLSFQRIAAGVGDHELDVRVVVQLHLADVARPGDGRSPGRRRPARRSTRCRRSRGSGPAARSPRAACRAPRVTSSAVAFAGSTPSDSSVRPNMSRMSLKRADAPGEGRVEQVVEGGDLAAGELRVVAEAGDAALPRTGCSLLLRVEPQALRVVRPRWRSSSAAGCGRAPPGSRAAPCRSTTQPPGVMRSHAGRVARLRGPAGSCRRTRRCR